MSWKLRKLAFQPAHSPKVCGSAVVFLLPMHFEQRCIGSPVINWTSDLLLFSFVKITWQIEPRWANALIGSSFVWNPADVQKMRCCIPKQRTPEDWDDNERAGRERERETDRKRERERECAQRTWRETHWLQISRLGGRVCTPGWQTAQSHCYSRTTKQHNFQTKRIPKTLLASSRILSNNHSCLARFYWHFPVVCLLRKLRLIHLQEKEKFVHISNAVNSGHLKTETDFLSVGGIWMLHCSTLVPGPVQTYSTKCKTSILQV